MKPHLQEDPHNLKRLLKKLEEVNSFYPATQQFLRSRGLEHVSELGTDGRQELLAHLQGLLSRMVH